MAAAFLDVLEILDDLDYLTGLFKDDFVDDVAA